jgi:hypothetical protein
MTKKNDTSTIDKAMQYETVLISVIHKAIIEDVELQKLHAKKVEIYSLATPTVILKDGKAETIWIDETNHPLIGKINELIELRTQQIINAYSN